MMFIYSEIIRLIAKKIRAIIGLYFFDLNTVGEGLFLKSFS